MVKFILKDESEFTGEVNRIAGRSLIVTGLLVFPDGVVSNLMNAAIAVDAIEEIIAADELEAAMIELARNYQPPEATRHEKPSHERHKRSGRKHQTSSRG